MLMVNIGPRIRPRRPSKVDCSKVQYEHASSSDADFNAENPRPHPLFDLRTAPEALRFRIKNPNAAKVCPQWTQRVGYDGATDSSSNATVEICFTSCRMPKFRRARSDTVWRRPSPSI